MIFLDSSFLVAYAVQGDSNHSASVELMEDVVGSTYGPPVISDYIFDETATVIFLRTKELRKSGSVGDAMLKSFRVLRVDEVAFGAAWRRFRSQKGTRYSFTDCTTIELMHRYGVGYIATFDRKFGGRKEFAALGVEQAD